MTSLQMHQTIHMQNKALVECKTCLKRFFNQRTLERHQKIHNNIKYKCMLCDKVVSNRKDNIRRHIRHLHPDFNRTEISTKIAELDKIQGNSEDDDDEDSGTSEQADLGTDNDLEKDDSMSFIILEEPTKPPSPLPVINNRVNVIQSIGNPNKKREPSPPQLPQEPHDDKIEITLPPKKKAIATIEPATTSVAVAPQPKPKYDPIEHYRKILGVSNDEPSVTIEDHHEEDESDEQVFPIHWRKRTSQNFLFRH